MLAFDNVVDMTHVFLSRVVKPQIELNDNETFMIGGEKEDQEVKEVNDSDRNPHNILPFLDEDKISIKNKHLYIKKSNIEVAGLGVFTNKDLNTDDIIEVAPVLRVQTKYLFQENNILNDYIFRDPYDENYKIVALGFGSMYNHSDSPNMKYFYQSNKMIYQAIKPISTGEELYISYGLNWWNYRVNKNKV
jgi:hypothetical protein